MIIACVAVVGQKVPFSILIIYIHICSDISENHDSLIERFNLVWLQNNPLYLQSFTSIGDDLKHHHIVHCSLDVIDERGFTFVF